MFDITDNITVSYPIHRKFVKSTGQMSPEVINDLNCPLRNFGNQTFQMEEHLADEGCVNA